MKFVARIFATMAFAFLLAYPLRADDTPRPASTTKAATTTDKDGAVKSSVAPASGGEATPAAPAPMPAPKTGGRTDGDTPRFELFLGYSNVLATPRNLTNRIDDLQGGDTNIAFNFNRYLGLVGDFAGYNANTLTFNQTGGPSRDVGADGKVFTYMGGPRLSYRRPHFTFFAQALFGDANARTVTINGCTGSPSCTPLPSENSFDMALGGGLDLNLNRHFAFRIIQAEYLMTRFMDPSSAAGTTGTRNNVRLSSGIVFRSGGNPPLPPTAVCSTQPGEVFAGESVTATATGSNFTRTVIYSWNGTGVRVSGSDASAQIDTGGLQPGGYVVTANLSDGRRNGSASCSARFTVKEPHPPVISCSADPSSVPIGGTSTITSTASSPDGRRLIYSYTTSAGDISGTGATGALNTQGAQPGRITVTCNVNDDRVQPLTASSTAMVEVQAPPPPPPPAPAPEIKQLEAKLALHSIYFQTARPTAEHPEGGLLDSQADILNALAADFVNYLKYMPDAHLILGGHADPRGTAEYNKKLTERRVERTKAFLVQHGVPTDHFELKAFGEEDQLTADQIKQQMADNPDLSAEERQKMTRNQIGRAHV